ncbi:MAG: NifB/NifX family molybdenum-iron cluster-binding protein [Desulfobacterales bacterium]|nr:NifB/NifX family molybdenum-iron cluster-binding protein [Desulfobacterales bacterium]
MKVALTVWGDRISPLFDAARELLIVEIQDAVVVSRRHEPIVLNGPLRLAERLAQQQIDVLICGAISELPARLIEAAGVKLVPFIAGAANDVLHSFAKGGEIVSAFSMPGCGCKKKAACRNRQNRSISPKMPVLSRK